MDEKEPSIFFVLKYSKYLHSSYREDPTLTLLVTVVFARQTPTFFDEVKSMTGKEEDRCFTNSVAWIKFPSQVGCF